MPSLRLSLSLWERLALRKLLGVVSRDPEMSEDKGKGEADADPLLWEEAVAAAGSVEEQVRLLGATIRRLGEEFNTAEGYRRDQVYRELLAAEDAQKLAREKLPTNRGIQPAKLRDTTTKTRRKDVVKPREKPPVTPSVPRDVEEAMKRMEETYVIKISELSALLDETNAEVERLQRTIDEKDREISDLRVTAGDRGENLRLADLRNLELIAKIKELDARLTGGGGDGGGRFVPPGGETPEQENLRRLAEKAVEEAAEKAAEKAAETEGASSSVREEGERLRAILTPFLLHLLSTKRGDHSGRIAASSLVREWKKVAERLATRAGYAAKRPDLYPAFKTVLHTLFVDLFSNTRLVGDIGGPYTPAIGITDLRTSLNDILANRLELTSASKNVAGDLEFGQLFKIASFKEPRTNYREIMDAIDLEPDNPQWNSANDTLRERGGFLLTARAHAKCRAQAHGDGERDDDDDDSSDSSQSGPSEQSWGDAEGGTLSLTKRQGTPDTSSAQGEWDRALSHVKSTATVPEAQAAHLKRMLALLDGRRDSLDLAKIRNDIVILRIQFPTRSSTTTIPVLIDAIAAKV